MMQATTPHPGPAGWRNEKRFLFIAAVCALLTALSTVVIHNLTFPAATFEEAVLLYKNNAYLTQKWTVMVHCLLVLLSMSGVAFVVSRYSLPLAVLGFVFFLLFVFTEWERTLNSLWYVNGLRRQFVAATDNATKQALRLAIGNNLLQSNVQFLLFTIGFTLGNFCYGLALAARKRGDRYLGAGLLLWSLCTSLAFTVDFYPAGWMETVIDWCNKYYQPLIRLLIGIWLWQKARQWMATGAP